MSYDADVLARQLAQLGMDLQDGVKKLGELERAAVTAEGKYRAKEYRYNYMLDKAFLEFSGGVEVRKAQARITSESYWIDTQEAYLDWGNAKADLKTQYKHISAIETRIDIGRSLLSKEKALIGLVNSGVGT